MKKLIMLLIFSILCFRSYSQTRGRIYNVAGGDGYALYAGDGLPATDPTVRFDRTTGICIDAAGNLYISDCFNARIRKVTASTGLLSTIAGTGVDGYSGDGGLAVNAEIEDMVKDVQVDNVGNVYFRDQGGVQIRKIDVQTGIITNFAGNGSGQYTGDGGLATNASINVTGLYIDVFNNVYFTQDDKIRRIDHQTNIITCFAGGGNPGIGIGDGGPALSAKLKSVFSIAGDPQGNIYFSQGNVDSGRIRKVDIATNIISTIAGSGILGNSGDGGPAINAGMAPGWISCDVYGNIYVESKGILAGKLRKIDAATGMISRIAGLDDLLFAGYHNPGIEADSVSIQGDYLHVDVDGNIYYSTYGGNVFKISYSNGYHFTSNDFRVTLNANECGITDFRIGVFQYSAGMHVETSFGDIQTNSSTINPGAGGGYALFDHSYLQTNIYQVKHVLYNGANAIDSISYPFNFIFCRTFPVKIFYDENADCAYSDSTDSYLHMPATVEVDSNNVHINTLSVISGLNYNARGSDGDIYKFKVAGLPAGLYTSCPVDGTITDTFKNAVMTNPAKYVGVYCNTTSDFNIREHVTSRAGVHQLTAEITVDNASCEPQNVVLTMNLSPKYQYASAYPVPTTITSNTLTWNFTGLSASLSDPVHIHITLETPGPHLPVGDTAMFTYSVTPVTGDLDVADNLVIKCDTVKGSWDPNEIQVTPQGHILAGTKLQYSIAFENDGNDTAHNIYVLDTLPNELEINSLRLISATATMNISHYNDGAHNIVKFDFPQIKLLDSSYHDQCTGMVIFTIDTKNGLPFGTLIDNRAGIYFDQNAVVLTNTVENVIGFPDRVTTIHQRQGLKVFPNPASDELNIEAEKNVFYSACVVNNIGQVMMQQKMNGKVARINIKQLPAGLYYIQLKGSERSEVRKFVKM